MVDCGVITTLCRDVDSVAIAQFGALLCPCAFDMFFFAAAFALTLAAAAGAQAAAARARGAPSGMQKVVN